MGIQMTLSLRFLSSAPSLCRNQRIIFLPCVRSLLPSFQTSEWAEKGWGSCPRGQEILMGEFYRVGSSWGLLHLETGSQKRRPPSSTSWRNLTKHILSYSCLKKGALKRQLVFSWHVKLSWIKAFAKYFKLILGMITFVTAEVVWVSKADKIWKYKTFPGPFYE